MMLRVRERSEDVCVGYVGGRDVWVGVEGGISIILMLTRETSFFGASFLTCFENCEGSERSEGMDGSWQL